MAKKSVTQEINTIVTQENPLVDDSTSLVDSILSRPELIADPIIATATASSSFIEGLKNIKEVERISFVRKNRESQKNLNKYFYGLLPIVNRKTIHACGAVTLAMFDGVPRESIGGDMSIVRDIGVVALLDDDQVLEAIQKIKKIGLKFHYKGATASVFKIAESEPSEHYWQIGEYPMGQFCYFESVPHLNKVYGSETGWRSKTVPMRTLIPRVPIPLGYQGAVSEDMGDGWLFHWPVKRKENLEEIQELSDHFIIQSAKLAGM